MPAQTEIFTLQGASDLRTYVTMCTHSATKRQIKTQTRPRRPLKKPPKLITELQRHMAIHTEQGEAPRGYKTESSSSSPTLVQRSVRRGGVRGQEKREVWCVYGLCVF